MATRQRFRPGLHYVARVGFFVGFTVLVLGIAVAKTPGSLVSLWWMLAAGIVLAVGLTAQYFSTARPLKPFITAPPGWAWFFVATVAVVPWFDWFVWHGPWLVVAGSIAASLGVWASFFPAYRHRAIQRQYTEQGPQYQTRSMTGSAARIAMAVAQSTTATSSVRPMSPMVID